MSTATLSAVRNEAQSDARSDATGTGRETRIEFAARRLFDAELALHDAHRTGVDAWIAAAADKLHLAIEEHSAALYATAA